MPTDAGERVGPRRLLVSLYAVFVVAAGARSCVQLLTMPRDAVLAYTLSAVAAAGYAVGLVLVLRTGRGVSARVAAAWCVVELSGVGVVGGLSVLRAGAFPDDTVWSTFGAGYGFVPVLLPLAVLAWLRVSTDVRPGAGSEKIVDGCPRQGSNLRPTA